jgi:hemoglobin
MKHIESREDIKLLVDQFYQKLLADELIGYLFTDIAKLDMEVHLPVMYDFWETMLLDHMIYTGNPMEKHLALNQKEKLLSEHFDRWLMHWENTVQQNFEGENADKAIERARNIALLMRYKVGQEF